MDVARTGRYGRRRSGRLLSPLMDREIADQRQVVGKLHVRYFETINLDLRTMQNEVEFLARTAAGVGGQAARIGIAESRRLHEQIEFMVAPVGIEVPGDDDRFAGLADEIEQIAQLVLAVPKLQRQMDQENGDIVQFQFDDETLYPGIEIMESFASHARRRQEGVGLFAYDGYQLIDRRDAVFALERRVMTQGTRDEISLVDHAGADRAGVDLDEPHHVRVLALDEVGDLRQDLPARAQVSGTRDGKMERGPGSRRISDVVDQQTHWRDCIDARCFAHDHRQATPGKLH